MAINFLSPEVRKEIVRLKKTQKRLLTVAKFLFGLGVAFLLISFIPSVWYSLASKVDDFSKAIVETVRGKKAPEEKPAVATVWQPVLDPSFSRSTTLIIPAIKVKTVIQEAPFENYAEALKKGVWRVSDFGTPAERKLPTILAAHRFGYLNWSNTFRRENSFYNLPKLKIGDIVYIIYKQRKYTYEVYGEGQGVEIKDYTADLILYTCQSLNSKIRIFKYARLLEI